MTVPLQDTVMKPTMYHATAAYDLILWTSSLHCIITSKHMVELLCSTLLPPNNMKILIWEITIFMSQKGQSHGSEDIDCTLLCPDVVWSCWWIYKITWCNIQADNNLYWHLKEIQQRPFKHTKMLLNRLINHLSTYPIKRSSAFLSQVKNRNSDARPGLTAGFACPT